jgi:hypothetical protein
MLWGYMQREGGYRERECGLAEGMGLQSERDVRMSETPSPVFFCVRSVISTPVCGENAHHVVLPAGKLSMIRPRKSIFDTYVTLLHYCFPYSLRASDTPNTTPSNLVNLIWHHPLLTHGALTRFVPPLSLPCDVDPTSLIGSSGT